MNTNSLEKIFHVTNFLNQFKNYNTAIISKINLN